MSDNSNKRREAGSIEKRGGYSSSTKPVSQFKPPRPGPAPGAKPSPPASPPKKK